MENNSKIYIAGHRGLVGSALVRALRADGYDNLLLRTSSDLDLRNQPEVDDFFAEEQPVRRVLIPKPDGSQRPLGIPTIRDRVVQMAVKLMIEPIFEADFCDCSYGFRPKRSAHDAMGDISYAMHKGHTEVIDADLSKYFDTIPHAKLLAVVAERIADGGILHLIKQWLKAPVVEKGADGKDRTSGGKGNRRGTPQGGVISPLLANLYLHLLDRIWERHGLEQKYAARLVRYADDMVLLCAKGTAKPLAMLKYILDRLDLTLNETKTKVIDAWEESFGFLGFEVRMNRGRSGKAYPHIQPSKRSVKRINARLTELTTRNLAPIPLPIIVRRLNQSLRGWSCYFDYANSTKVAETDRPIPNDAGACPLLYLGMLGYKTWPLRF